jgi:hypothetical protein
MIAFEENATIEKTTTTAVLRIKCQRSSPRCSIKLILFLSFFLFIKYSRSKIRKTIFSTFENL